MKPSVSVIIPVFNSFKYLEEALASVRRQSFEDFEVVVVDDGSDSEIEPYLSRFPEARLIRQKNMGVAVARNVGVYNSLGEYIAFLDADDLWHQDKLAHQVEVMENDPEIGLCYTRCQIVDGAGQAVGVFPEYGSETYEDLLKSFSIILSSTLVRKNIFNSAGGFDPLCTFAQDLEFFLKVARHWKVKFCADQLTAYRRHSSNRTREAEALDIALSIFARHRAHAQCNRDTALVAASEGGYRWARSTSAFYLGNIGAERLSQGQLAEAMKYFRKAAIVGRSFKPLARMLRVACAALLKGDLSRGKEISTPTFQTRSRSDLVSSVNNGER